MEVCKAVGSQLAVLVTTAFNSYNIESLFARISVLNEFSVCGPTPIPPSKVCMVPLLFLYPIDECFL